MSEPIKYYFKYDKVNPGLVFKAPEKMNKKFNLKIRKADLDLIDKIKEIENVPRSVILNFLIHQVLETNLKNIEQPDVRLLLAREADKKLSPDGKITSKNFVNSWMYVAINSGLKVPVETIYHNVANYNQLDSDPNAEGVYHHIPENQCHSQEYKDMVQVMGWEL